MADFSAWGRAVEAGASSGAEHGGGLEDVLGGESDFDHVPEGGIDIVFHAAEVDLAILDHGVGATPVTVARLSDAAGVQDLDTVDLDQELEVRVSDADDVGFDASEPGFPGSGLFGEEVFVEGIVRGGVDEAVVSSIEVEPLSDR